MMIRKTLFFLLLSSSVHALYIVDTVSRPVDLKHVIAIDQYPEICRVKTLSSWGTGTLIAPHVVLTARHVVEGRDDQDHFWEQDPTKTFEPPDPSKIIVIFEDEERNVAAVHVFKNGHLDMALLELQQPLDHLEPRLIRAVKLGERIQNMTLAGFGDGRLICDWEPYNPERKHALLAHTYNCYYHGELEKYSVFRVFKNVHGNRFISKDKRRAGFFKPLKIDIRSKFVLVGAGDSGGPLFDGEGNIIGIAKSSDGSLIEDGDDMGEDVRKEVLRNHGRPQKYMASLVVFETLFMAYVYTFCTDLNLQDTFVSAFYTMLFFHLLSEIMVGAYSDSPSFYDFLCYKTRYLAFHQYAKEQDDRIIEQLNKRKIFFSTYLAISPQVKKWINGSIKKRK